MLGWSLFFSFYSHSHFKSNAVFGLEESLADVAAMRLYRVRLILNGTTLFSNNSGGGLDITQGRVDVAAMVTFERNKALLGGAMRLFGQSQVSNKQHCNCFSWLHACMLCTWLLPTPSLHKYIPRKCFIIQNVSQMLEVQYVCVC